MNFKSVYAVITLNLKRVQDNSLLHLSVSHSTYQKTPWEPGYTYPFELNVPAGSLVVDPAELRLLRPRLYEVIAETFCEDRPAAEKLLAEGEVYEGLDFYRAFFPLQRDIAGAVFMCDRAMESGNTVFVTLG